jgi:arsenate reductase (thioredoxin)
LNAAKPFRVLFVCTANSARSQMAEALLGNLGGGRFAAASAGAIPAGRVSRRAVTALAELGIDWSGHTPRGLDGLDREQWDLVITVCDAAKQACPVFTGSPAVVHWDLPDPMDVDGTEDEQLQAFRRSRDNIAGLVERLIALPLEALRPRDLVARVTEIGPKR